MKTDTLEVRVSPDEKQAIRTAAERAGLALSTWVRMIVLRATRRVPDRNVMVGATRREVVQGAVATTVPVRSADEQKRELMLGFCSLGDNCEFGFAQRTYQAEPIDLFRWAGTHHDVLVQLFANKFEGIGNDLIISEMGDEYMIRNARYRTNWHSFTKLPAATPEAVNAREKKRLPYLAGKLMQDVQDAERIFVLKGSAQYPANKEAAAALLWLLETYGGKPTLMFVTDGAETVHVELEQPRLLHGRLIQFAAGDAVPRTTRSADWLDLCRQARSAMCHNAP